MEMGMMQGFEWPDITTWPLDGRRNTRDEKDVRSRRQGAQEPRKEIFQFQ